MNGDSAITARELAGSSWLQAQSEKWNRDFKFLIRQTRVLNLLLRHPQVPWYAKAVAACTVGYLFSPIQIIPAFIPIIGQLDDVAVLVLGMKLLRLLTPKSVMAECEWKADMLLPRRSAAVSAGCKPSR